MRKRPFRLVTVAVVCFVSILLHAQSTQTDVTTITSSTELVLIPVVVHDKSGSHVSGLTKEQFVLKQDGRPQPSAIFEEVRTTIDRVRRSEGEKGTFSNMEPGSSQYYRLSIIVLDFVNTPFVDRANARDALIKFLSGAVQSGEPMCLLVLTSNGLKLLHDFTDDPKRLAVGLQQAQDNSPAMIHEATIDPHHPAGGDALSHAITQMIRESLQDEGRVASLETKAAASLTVQALQQIAKAFRGLPGRKSLIWASSGFPFSLSPGAAAMCEPACPIHGRGEMQSAYDNLWKYMNDAQIAIYSVDLRSASAEMQMSTGGVRPSDIGDPDFDVDAQARDKSVDTTGTLEQFAENTGGKAFLGGSNLQESFRQAIQDDSSYYMLGYYVSSKNIKAGWHNISVSVRGKDAQVRYRKGFILSRDTSPLTARQDIHLALSSPLDYTGIPLSVTWSGTQAGKVPGNSKAGFDLVMPPSFASLDLSDSNHMIVDIAAAATNPKGEVVADMSKRVDVHLDAAGLEQIRQNGMTYRNAFQLPPGEYIVRFVVRDSVGNRMGSVAAPLAVRP